MRDADYSDATVVLLGHGTELNADSAASVRRHASDLRKTGLFAEVREAFWKQEPRVTNVLANIESERVFIVPFFLSEGYFSESVIPISLGFGGVDANEGECGIISRYRQTLFYCRPAGTHPDMSDVILDRALGMLRTFPFPVPPEPLQTTLFIAGHGTPRNANSRKMVELQARRLAATGPFAAVHGVFMEEEPRIAEVYALSRTRNLVVVPFFTSDGLHVREDIPVMLGEPPALAKRRVALGQVAWRNPTERNGKLVWYSQAVGSDPIFVRVIVDLVRQAAAWKSHLNPVG